MLFFTVANVVLCTSYFIFHKCLTWNLDWIFTFNSSRDVLVALDKDRNIFILDEKNRKGQYLGPELLDHSYSHLLFNYKSFRMRSKVLSMIIWTAFLPNNFSFARNLIFPISTLSHIITNIKKAIPPDYTASPCPSWQCYIWIIWNQQRSPSC